MAVTDEDEERTVRALLADVEATLGPGYESMVRDIARRLREFIDDPDWYFERVVDDTQQDFHDGYIDTGWPKCPVHDGRHPLWLADRGWWCQKNAVLIAAVGDSVCGSVRIRAEPSARTDTPNRNSHLHFPPPGAMLRFSEPQGEPPMLRALALASLLLVPLTAGATRAECVKVPPKQVLDAPGTELVFSGRVVDISQSGDYGARASFKVGQVWKGQVPEAFSVYTWYLDSAEAPRYEKGRLYVVVAKRLTDKRARAEVGLGASDSLAFTGVTCSGDYSVEEFMQALGIGRGPTTEIYEQSSDDVIAGLIPSPEVRQR